MIKAGVRPERIAPGKPQQNGRHERLHLTLLQDTASPPARSLRQQLDRFHAFQRIYNEERPHQALGNTTPADHYAPRRAAGTGCCANPDYPAEHQLRRVRHNGEIKWQGTTIYISRRSSASRSASPRPTTAAWSSATARSSSASSTIAPTAFANPNARPVDLWTTLAGSPQPPQPQRPHHRAHEQTRKTVTHVAGQICYPCPRLLIAPVFLVDELDKIDELNSSMAHLVQRMKHLVADYSFFCFLTDRDYFEYLFDLSRKEAYPREHTYFSHRLFVIHRPQHLHAYLNQLLHSVGVTPNAPASPTSDELGKCALAHLLLHRAMMHTFDLQRELARVCNEAGYVMLNADQLVTHLGYRFNIMVQLAIEHLLAEEEMRDRLDQDPLSGQLAYDALYYVSRNWLEGDGDLDVGEPAINAYLAVRLKNRKDAQQRQETEVARIGDVLGPLDRQFLIDKIRRIAHLLADPATLQTELYSRPDLDDLGRQLIETVPAGEEMRLLSRMQDPMVYRWHRDPFGRRLIDLEQPTVTTERQHADDALIENLNWWLVEIRLSPTALAESGILRTSPAWSQVQDARVRLSSFSRLVIAGAIARDAGMDVRTGIRVGMETLGRAISFRSADENAAIAAVNYPGLPIPLAPQPAVPLEYDTFGAWRDEIEVGGNTSQAYRVH